MKFFKLPALGDYNRTSDANYVHTRFVATFSSGSLGFFSITGGRALKRQLKRDTISLGGLATTYRGRIVAKFRGDRAPTFSRSINCCWPNNKQQEIVNKPIEWRITSQYVKNW